MFLTIYLRRTLVCLSMLCGAESLQSFAWQNETPSADSKQVAEPSQEEFTGRVVLESDPDEGVAGLGVHGGAIRSDFQRDRWRFHGRTDKDGYFSGPAISERGYLTVVDSAQLRGAIQIVEPGQNNIVLSLAPTASIYGTVFDAQHNVPAARHRVQADVRFTDDQQWSSSIFVRKGYTDEKGKFLIEGLVPGFNYRLTSKSPEAGAYDIGRFIGTVQPTSAKHIKMDDLQIPKTHPTLEEFIASRYVDKSAEDRLTRGLNMARLGNVNLLVIAMERDDQAAKQFYQFLYDYCHHRGIEDPKLQIHQFIPLSLAPSESNAFLDEHGIAKPAKDDGTFAILDAKGKILAQKAFADLRSDGDFDPKQFAQFLEANVHPPLANAQEELDSALAEALRDNKRVLIQTCGPGCGPCYLLAEYLESHKSFVTKDYVVLKLDSRMPEFSEVYEKLSSDTPRGIPWMVILDAEGNILITGDTDEGNIGFPTDGEGLAQFKRMLTTTRQNLTDEEISTLIASLREKGEEILKSRE